MKRNIQHLILGGIFLLGAVSCQSVFESSPSPKKHRVHFTSAEKETTKTGITIEEGTVTPDWRATDKKNVHLFEVAADKSFSYGTDVTISVSSDYKTAQFMADFPTEMEIIVNPGDGGAKAGSGSSTPAGPYTYAAVIAQKTSDYTFIVPSVQNPDPETLIDPAADFLLGYSRTSYDDPHNYDELLVDLYFDRPVAMSRLSLSNFTVADEKVKSVVINTEGSITGFASYEDIDFSASTVNFHPEEAPGILTLVYDKADVPADGVFPAYFVSIPGTVKINSIVVKTDKSVYTREIAGGKEFTFSAKSFKNINVDLSKAVREDAVAENITWYKATVLEDGVNYLIVSGGMALNNAEDGLTGVAVTDEDGIIRFTEAPASSLIWRADAITGLEEYGHFTISNGEGVFLQRHSDSATQTMIVGGIPSGDKKYYVWNYDGTFLSHVSSPSDNRIFYCYYDGGWKTGYEEASAKSVGIYTSRTPQEISFGVETVEYDLDEGGEFTFPKISGAVGEVTYSSSNPSVATIDGNGDVTILKAGTTVITATAAGDKDYQAASASYTLIVSSGSVDTFYLASEIVDGEDYMIVSGGYAMTVDGTSLGTVSVTENDGVIQISAAEVALFKAKAHVEYYSGTSPAGHYTLGYGDNFLQRQSNGNTQNLVIGGIPSNKKYYVWEYDGQHLYHLSSADNTFYVGYDGGWVFKYSGTLPNAYLYTVNKPKQSQKISFSEQSVSAVLGVDFTAPTLSGVKTSVTFDSSDESVATVNATTGDVTLVGLGETVITATAEENDEYNKGTASYTLKVTDGNIPVFYKAEEIEAGKEYLIVSNGYLLRNDGGSIAAVAVTEKADGSVEYDAPATDLWTVSASSGTFTLKNDGKYVNRNSSTISVSSTSTSWSYDAASPYITNKGSSSTYYLYYSTGSSKWSSSTSSGSTHTAALYGTTPPKKTQELSFSGTSFTFDMAEEGATFTPPTLSGDKTPVTYSSSKSGVATVTSDGVVTIVGVGSTVITATAAANDEYKEATASYTLKVVNTSAPVSTKKYVLATTIEDGKNYLVVSGGYALKNDGGTVASVAVTPVDDVIEFTPGEETDLVWTAEARTDLTQYGDFVFSNEGYYLRRPNQGGTSVTFEHTPSSWSKYFVYLYDGEHLYHLNTATSSSGSTTDYVYCISYNDGSWVFSYKTGKDPAATGVTTHLYVEE
ncbi:MAG: Ig-like domain-containing protein [Bacteroidales bacterium]|nr:Ig-like domain-containing protein [Bacteroidales bacterium]